MSKFKPQLAATLLDAKTLDLTHGVWASPKIDGIRYVNPQGQALARSLKAFPNTELAEFFSQPEFQYLDGELVAGDPCDEFVYKKTFSAVMSKQADWSDVRLHVFDHLQDLNAPFTERFEMAREAVAKINLPERAILVPHDRLTTIEEINSFEVEALGNGLEGIMLRNPLRTYKCGRSTMGVKDQGLVKVKRTVQSEAVIIQVLPRMHNANEATTNELGNTHRSSHKENLVPLDIVGRLAVRVLDEHGRASGDVTYLGVFKGFTLPELTKMWAERDSLIGKIVTFEHFAIGGYDLPRHGRVLKGFRSPLDM